MGTVTTTIDDTTGSIGDGDVPDQPDVITDDEPDVTTTGGGVLSYVTCLAGTGIIAYKWIYPKYTAWKVNRERTQRYSALLIYRYHERVSETVEPAMKCFLCNVEADSDDDSDARRDAAACLNPEHQCNITTFDDWCRSGNPRKQFHMCTECTRAQIRTNLNVYIQDRADDIREGRIPANGLVPCACKTATEPHDLS